MTSDGYGTAEIMRATGKAKTVIWRWQDRFRSEGAAGLWRAPLAYSTAEPCSGRAGYSHDLGGAAASSQLLDGRGDGEGGWDQRQFGATNLARSWPATASGPPL
jgi:hypothetical protein